jgi:capsular polysaccharide biosynthesis protein
MVVSPTSLHQRLGRRRRRGAAPHFPRLRRLAARLPYLRELRRLLRGDRDGEPPIVCDSVLAWAIAHPGTPYSRIAAPGSVTKKPPRTIEMTIDPQFVAEKEIAIAEKYVVELRGAILEIPRAANRRSYGRQEDAPRLVLPDGSVAVESTQWLVKRCLPHPFDVAREMRGDYVSLLSPRALHGNYYHWTHDVLLSLFGLFAHLPATTRFVVPPGLRPFQLDSLAMLGITPAQLVTFDDRASEHGDSSWRLDRLFFSPGPIGASVSASALAWLRAIALEYAGAADRRPHRRLYISRRRARYRRIVNETEVVGYLLGRGFEVHELEDYGYREQISLFADAEVVVGPHGAAHTNMLFAQPGMVLVDIFGSLVNRCFHNMALTLGHEYWYVFGEDIRRAHAKDIYLPLEKLDSIVSLALTSDAAPSESCHPPI